MYLSKKKQSDVFLTAWFSVIRLGPLNSDAVWWVSASYQPVGRVTHLSITLILQCSAQDCKSCNAKLQNLFQSPISQTVKKCLGSWSLGSWVQILSTVFSAAIVTALNFGNKTAVLYKGKAVRLSSNCLIFGDCLWLYLHSVFLWVLTKWLSENRYVSLLALPDISMFFFVYFCKDIINPPFSVINSLLVSLKFW